MILGPVDRTGGLEMETQKVVTCGRHLKYYINWRENCPGAHSHTFLVPKLCKNRIFPEKPDSAFSAILRPPGHGLKDQFSPILSWTHSYLHEFRTVK